MVGFTGVYIILDFLPSFFLGSVRPYQEFLPCTGYNSYYVNTQRPQSDFNCSVLPRHLHRVRLINKSTRGKRPIQFNATTGGDDDATSTPGARHKQEDPPTSDAYDYEFDDDAEKDAYELYSEVMLSLLEEAAASERRGGEGATPIAWL